MFDSFISYESSSDLSIVHLGEICRECDMLVSSLHESPPILGVIYSYTPICISYYKIMEKILRLSVRICIDNREELF